MGDVSRGVGEWRWEARWHGRGGKDRRGHTEEARRTRDTVWEARVMVSVRWFREGLATRNRKDEAVATGGGVKHVASAAVRVLRSE